MKLKNATVYNNNMANIVAEICTCEFVNAYKNKIEKLKNFQLN